MNGFTKLATLSAFVFLGCSVLFAASLIAAIWGDFENPAVWKLVASSFILFFLSGVFHAVAKGMGGSAGGGS